MITTVSQQLLHLKIEISSCFGVTDLTFAGIQNVSNVALYTETADADFLTGDLFLYDETDYIQPNPYLLCPPPTITSFSPEIISTGTNSVLTIQVMLLEMNEEMDKKKDVRYTNAFLSFSSVQLIPDELLPSRAHFCFN